jgi:DNA-binding MarR family transcriptional regulator
MLTITTKSQNTIDAYKYLEANQGSYFTIKQVAEALGLTSAQVTGGLVSLTKKEVVSKTDLEVDGKTYKGYAYAAPATFEFEAVKNMSDKAVQMLQFLQKNANVDLTSQDIAEAMGIQAIAVTGVVNGLVKKNLVLRDEAEAEMPDGTKKKVKFISLTDEGKNYAF